MIPAFIDLRGHVGHQGMCSSRVGQTTLLEVKLANLRLPDDHFDLRSYRVTRTGYSSKPGQSAAP
jgi:hypothetical protein